MLLLADGHISVQVCQLIQKFLRKTDNQMVRYFNKATNWGAGQCPWWEVTQLDRISLWSSSGFSKPLSVQCLQVCFLSLYFMLGLDLSIEMAWRLSLRILLNNLKLWTSSSNLRNVTYYQIKIELSSSSTFSYVIIYIICVLCGL